jgi:hypothetical protein
MLTDFGCPVCQALDWEKVEEYEYDAMPAIAPGGWAKLVEELRILARVFLRAAPGKGPVRRWFVTPYQALRRKVLLHVWGCSGRLASLLCRRCGFVCCTPRPTAQEVDRKYGFLKIHEPNIGGQDPNDTIAIQRDTERSERVFGIVSKHVTKGMVLDYGGGNGKLLRAFLSRGFTCHLADYSERQLPGIVRIADDVEGLADMYDAMILSHVLEHSAEPGGLLRSLGNHLKDTGFIYIEVPLEIWAGTRADGDAVTHVNYFTLASLRTLVQRSGFRIVDSRQCYANYGRAKLEVAWIVARKGEEPAVYDPLAARAMLWPSRLRSAVRLWRLVSQ